MLTDFAASFGTKDLKDLADQVVDAIDPDGTLPDEKVNADRRHLSLRKCRDGMYAGEFRLTGTAGAKLTALLEPLAQPRADTAGDANGDTTGDCDPFSKTDRKPDPDERTFGARMHDALEEVCDRVLRAGDVTGVGGAPATVIVTITLEDLLDQLGYGTTSDGTLIPTPEVIRMANEADLVPAFVRRTGEVLELGRSRRLASRAQTCALIVRDRGCSFPGCDRAPEWCERHHIVDWAAGGLTDLNNLTLLCGYHHHNFANRGWTCRLNSDGIPEWRPPKWLDRDQKPLINSRIAAHLAAGAQRRRSKGPAVKHRTDGAVRQT